LGKFALDIFYWKGETRASRLVASALGARRTATDRPCAFRLCFYYRATQRVSPPVTTTQFLTLFFNFFPQSICRIFSNRNFKMTHIKF
jgi:hypothetical protein